MPSWGRLAKKAMKKLAGHEADEPVEQMVQRALRAREGEAAVPGTHAWEAERRLPVGDLDAPTGKVGEVVRGRKTQPPARKQVPVLELEPRGSYEDAKLVLRNVGDIPDSKLERLWTRVNQKFAKLGLDVEAPTGYARWKRMLEREAMQYLDEALPRQAVKRRSQAEAERSAGRDEDIEKFMGLKDALK